MWSAKEKQMFINWTNAVAIHSVLTIIWHTVHACGSVSWFFGYDYNFNSVNSWISVIFNGKELYHWETEIGVLWDENKDIRCQEYITYDNILISLLFCDVKIALYIVLHNAHLVV